MLVPEDEPTDVVRRLLTRNVLYQSVAAVRRPVLLDVGGYDETLRYSEDYDLWLRIARRAPFVCTHRVTGHYRVHPGQATRLAERLARGAWEVRHRFWERARAEGPPTLVAEVEGLLREAWSADLRAAWTLRDRGLLASLLALGDLVPGSAVMRQRWS